jgi:hypothetical protein
MKYKKINVLAEGLSGKCGKKVYYQLHGKTFVRKASKTGYNKIATDKQAAVRARFMAANQFAQSVIHDPVLKAFYEKKTKKGCSAYNLAISEFLRS